MKTCRRPEVGEILFLVKRHYYGHMKAKTQTTTVLSVGRKYFKTCAGEFEIANWKEKTDHCSYLTLYANEQEYLDKLEAQKIWGDISGITSSYNCPFTLDQLKRIKLIIDEL